nr:hypothetical transcript [Hymenolepis microstoma]
MVSQIISALFRELSHLPTTAYHPKANRLIYYFHRQLESAIVTTSSRLNRSELLPIILLAIRKTVEEDLGFYLSDLFCSTKNSTSFDRLKPPFLEVPGLIPTIFTQSDNFYCTHTNLSNATSTPTITKHLSDTSDLSSKDAANPSTFTLLYLALKHRLQYLPKYCMSRPEVHRTRCDRII